MAHYECPTCHGRSHWVATQAEAGQLLKTHLAYFCTGAGRATRRLARAIR